MLQIKNISKTYKEGKKNVEALKDVSLNINKGEFVALVGPSGCGKSTLLRCIADLIKITKGKILLNKKEIKKSQSKMGMIFQHFSSFPWLTIRENIEFGLNLKKISKKRKKEIVDHYLFITGLKDFADVYPKDLSGGMNQRVGIARTLANSPEVVLMDEPFSSLDGQTKSLMQELLLTIWNKNKTTVFFVTHDVEEAIFLADRVYIMSTKPGEIKEEVKINLLRPRSIETKLSEEFLKLKRHIYYVIRGEAIKAAQFSLKNLKEDTIKIGLHTWAGITPFYYARDKGNFSKNRLDIELIELEKDKDRIDAFINEEIDLLHLSVDTIHYLKEVSKQDVGVAMLIDNSIGGDALISRNSIKSIKELKGKKVGVERNMFSHFFLIYLLNKNKININDVDVVFLKSSDIGTKFLTHEIDAAVLWEPWLSHVLKISKGNILSSTKQEKDKIISVLFARKDFIQKHKRELVKLNQVWDNTIFKLKKDRINFDLKLAPYIGITENNFKLQMDNLEFITKKNRTEYQNKVKKLISESKKIWNLMKK